MTGFELMHVSNTACSLVTFLLSVVLNLAAWLIVLTTVDRFVAVWLPLHAAAFCRRRRACLAILVLVFIVIAASLHLFWTTGLYQSSGRTLPYCGPSPDAHFMHRQFEYIKLTSYSLAPFAIILSLNVAIVARLRCGKAASMLLRGNTGHAAAVPQAAMASKVTYMLLAVSATWLILSAPFTLQALLSSVLMDVKNPASVARYRLLRTVCFQLMYTNHAVNFFLYCIAGRKFRHELRDMYRELCCACHASTDPCGGCCVAGGEYTTAACGMKMEQDATAEMTTKHVQTRQELAVMTTCRSTDGSSLVVQSVAAGGVCADTAL